MNNSAGVVRSPAFRPQGSDADPFRDAKRLRPKGGTTNRFQPTRNITDYVITWGCEGGHDRTAVAGSKKTERLESAAGGAAARRVSNLPLPPGKRKTARAGEVGGQGRSRIRIV